ncbi:CerR family C-terminal domain-containing protein [Glaciecola sp. 1036]|uniref:CerR family C-terminal domain-containing protein n=1 Tax=Alteromonadaceae TaxID=72275 RepID=UPI003D03E662
MTETVTSQDILESQTALSLIEAGIDQFGLFGLKATTRSIAEQAKANIAAIPYYFRNKNGLYNACMHFIVDAIWRKLGKNISQLMTDVKSLSAHDAKQAYLSIMDAFCQFFLQDPNTARWAQLIMREHAAPTQAYEIFYSRYYVKIQALNSQLIAKCLNQHPEDKSVVVMCHALFGQALGFLIAKETLLRAIREDVMSTEVSELIRNTIKSNLNAILTQKISQDN